MSSILSLTSSALERKFLKFTVPNGSNKCPFSPNLGEQCNANSLSRQRDMRALTRNAARGRSSAKDPWQHTKTDFQRANILNIFQNMEKH